MISQRQVIEAVQLVGDTDVTGRTAWIPQE